MAGIIPVLQRRYLLNYRLVIVLTKKKNALWSAFFLSHFFAKKRSGIA